MATDTHPAAALPDALAKLREAEERLAVAARAATDAARAETAARNAMNEAQKEVSTLVEMLKAKAPADSDWGLERRRGTSA